MNSHKFHIVFLVFMLFVFTFSPGLKAQSLQLSGNTPAAHAVLSKDTADSLPANKKNQRQKKRQERNEYFKSNGGRYFVSLSYVFAKLSTTINFNVPGSVVNIATNLESNLGFPVKSSFLSGSFIYRITPSSGVYFSYYGFNRSSTHATRNDVIWGTDTIPAGTQSKVFFRTQVISVGYILSLLKKPETFLGVYLNFYFMPIKLGYSSDLIKKSANYDFTAPLPNVGLVGSFQLNKWLLLNGNLGFFALYTKDLGGYIHDLNISLLFKITKLLNFNVNYQVFNVYVIIPNEKINTSVNYEFKGPAVGITLTF